MSTPNQCPYGPSDGAYWRAPLGNVYNRLLLSQRPSLADRFTFRRLPPAFQSPGLMKHLGVGLNDLLQT